MTFEEKSAWAGEYVLGTLSADERRRIEAAMAADAELAAAVRYWEEQLVGLTAAVPSEAPPPELWDRIERATGNATAPLSATSEAGADIVAFRRKVAGWRTATIAATAIAAALAAIIIIRPGLEDEPATGERYVAVVDRGGELPALLVEVNTGNGTVAVVSVAAEPPAGRSHELWYIVEGSDPRSLGLVDTVGAGLELSLDQLGAFSAEEALFAITEEPLGGSPTGQPTSSPIFTGRLVPAPDQNVRDLQ